MFKKFGNLEMQQEIEAFEEFQKKVRHAAIRAERIRSTARKYLNLREMRNLGFNSRVIADELINFEN